MLVFPVRDQRDSAAYNPQSGVATVLYNDDIGLTGCKERVGEAKLRHGDAAWRTAVAQVNPLEHLTHHRSPWVASRAYYKLIELVDLLPLPPAGVFLHLCDAPGGFVQAAHDMYGEQWVAHSLQVEPTERSLSSETTRSTNALVNPPCASPSSAPFKRVPVDGKVLKLAEHGDILKPIAFKQLSNLTSIGPHPQYGLVTADGSVNFEHNHARAEVENEHVILREALVAKSVLAQGGCFILKMFDCRTEATLGIVQLVASWFERTRIAKPETSRPTNSERYLVCSGFCASNAPLCPPDPSLPLARVVDKLNPELLRHLIKTERSLAERQQLFLERAFHIIEGRNYCDVVDSRKAWMDTHGRRIVGDSRTTTRR